LKEDCQFADGTPGTKCDGYDACLGIDSSKVGCGSCHGEEACIHGHGQSTTDKVIVGENSCNGKWACKGHIAQLDAGVVIGKGSW
jgi:hypothetical protein